MPKHRVLQVSPEKRGRPIIKPEVGKKKSFKM
jgi:hypothetical protein